MNTAFETWLIADTKKQPTAVHKSFLRGLRFEPESVLVGAIENCLLDWATQFCVEKGEVVRHVPGDGMAESILASWKEHYKEELSKITE